MRDVDAEDADTGVGAFTRWSGAQERQLREGRRDVAEVVRLPNARRGATAAAFAAAAHASQGTEFLVSLRNNLQYEVTGWCLRWSS